MREGGGGVPVRRGRVWCTSEGGRGWCASEEREGVVYQ